MHIDDIYDDDVDFFESDKLDGDWYLGMIGCTGDYDHRLLLNTISPRVFFKYPYDQICDYLTTYSMMDPERVLPGVRIIQLRMHPEGYYLAVDKTVHLIRIQRWWRKQYRAFRRDMIRQLPFREQHGFFRVRDILK
jgi:hypothetical protein